MGQIFNTILKTVYAIAFYKIVYSGLMEMTKPRSRQNKNTQTRQSQNQQIDQKDKKNIFKQMDEYDYIFGEDMICKKTKKDTDWQIIEQNQEQLVDGLNSINDPIIIIDDGQKQLFSKVGVSQNKLLESSQKLLQQYQVQRCNKLLERIKYQSMLQKMFGQITKKTLRKQVKR